MVERYRTIVGAARHEGERVKGSRFIGHAEHCDSEARVERLLKHLRAEFPDATHHCWAFRLGDEGQRYRFHDDGEPGGSAGRPILQQIEGQGLTEIVVVVVRYFGGTKLGVGGLVRAYGGATAAVLRRAEPREVFVTRRIAVVHPYECTQEVQRVLAGCGLSPVGADYGEAVRLELEVPLGSVDELTARLRDATSGRAEVLTGPDRTR